MTRRIRFFLYALLCFGLIVLTYFQVPASFYTLAVLLGVMGLFFAIRGLRSKT